MPATPSRRLTQDGARPILGEPPLLVGAVALIDEAGRVLMQQRRADKQHGGLWEFPGGKLEPGETPEQATVREIAEELGLVIDPVTLAPAGFASATLPSGRGIVLLLFSCRDWRGTPDCNDAEALRWCTLDEIIGLALPPLDVPLAAALSRLL
jgi:8-oxo-dGTP diphosphatase